MNELLAGLNDKQKEAVLHFEGPLLILAGAGDVYKRQLNKRKRPRDANFFYGFTKTKNNNKHLC